MISFPQSALRIRILKVGSLQTSIQHPPHTRSESLWASIKLELIFADVDCLSPRHSLKIHLLSPPYTVSESYMRLPNSVLWISRCTRLHSSTTVRRLVATTPLHPTRARDNTTEALADLDTGNGGLTIGGVAVRISAQVGRGMEERRLKKNRSETHSLSRCSLVSSRAQTHS